MKRLEPAVSLILWGELDQTLNSFLYSVQEAQVPHRPRRPGVGRIFCGRTHLSITEESGASRTQFPCCFLVTEGLQVSIDLLPTDKDFFETAFFF